MYCDTYARLNEVIDVTFCFGKFSQFNMRINVLDIRFRFRWNRYPNRYRIDKMGLISPYLGTLFRIKGRFYENMKRFYCNFSNVTIIERPILSRWNSKLITVIDSIKFLMSLRNLFAILEMGPLFLNNVSANTRFIFIFCEKNNILCPRACSVYQNVRKTAFWASKTCFSSPQMFRISDIYILNFW